MKPSREEVLRIAKECNFKIEEFGLAMYEAGAESERAVSDRLLEALQRIAKLRIVEVDEVLDDYAETMVEAMRKEKPE